MFGNMKKWNALLLGFWFAWVASALASGEVVGFVAGSVNATVGGHRLGSSTALFSGDRVEVKDGAAVVSLGQASRIQLESRTSALFSREGRSVTVELEEGTILMLQSDDRSALQLKAGTIRVVGAPGFRTLGEVTLVNGLLQVATKEGLLRVQDKGSAVEVAKGRTVTINLRVAQHPSSGSGAGQAASATPLRWGAVGAGVVSAITSGVAASRAGDAKAASETLEKSASQAVAAAQSADDAAKAAEQASQALDDATYNLLYCGIASVYQLPPIPCR